MHYCHVEVQYNIMMTKKRKFVEIPAASSGERAIVARFRRFDRVSHRPGNLRFSVYFNKFTFKFLFFVDAKNPQN